MMMSELVERLEQEIAENGDLPVYLKDWSDAYAKPCELNVVEIYGDRVFLDTE